MKSELLALGALALVLGGCTPKAPEAKSPTPTPVASNDAPSPSSSPVKPEPSSEQTLPRTITPDNGKEAGVAESVPNTNPMVDKFEKKVGHTRRPKGLDIQPENAGQWKPASITPLELANQVESTLASTTKVSASIVNAMEVAGGHGGSDCLVSIKDRENFRAEYAVPTFEPRPGIAKYRMIAGEGKFAVMAINDGRSTVKPYATLPAEVSSSVQDWSISFGRNLFTTYGGGKPLTALVKMVQKPGSGLTVKAEEQTFMVNGRAVHQQRILVSRSPEQAATLGKFSIEVINDAMQHLPVTMRTNIEAPKKDPLRMYWTIRWNLKPGQVFEDSMFKIPEGKVAQRSSSASRA